MDKLLLGKPVADNIKENIKNRVNILLEKNISPNLAIVRVGEKADDIAYENSAVNVLNSLGIKTTKYLFTENITTNELAKEVEEINKNAEIHGILIFRPLPKHIDENEIASIISSEKDVDCMSQNTLGEILNPKQMTKRPCTAQAVIEILKFYNIEIESKNIVVLGRSAVIGKSVALLLLEENATVTICHSKTKNLKQICQNADILVSSIGKAKFVNSEFVKKGAIVIDVGINEINGQIVGDVDFDDVSEKASKITPVPRGVGSVTTSILAQNLINSIKI